MVLKSRATDKAESPCVSNGMLGNLLIKGSLTSLPLRSFDKNYRSSVFYLAVSMITAEAESPPSRCGELGNPFMK